MSQYKPAEVVLRGPKAILVKLALKAFRVLPEPKVTPVKLALKAFRVLPEPKVTPVKLALRAFRVLPDHKENKAHREQAPGLMVPGM